MNKNKLNIESMLENLGLQSVPHDVHDIAEEHTKDFLANSSKRAHLSLWGSFGRERIVKFAAAAVAAVVVVVVMATVMIIHNQIIPLNVTTTAFAQMKEVIAKMPWQHTVVTVRDRKEGALMEHQYERWFSYESKIGITRENGFINSYDLYKRKSVAYNPDTDKVTVSYLSPDGYQFQFYRDNVSPLDLVEGLIESFKTSGADVERIDGQYEGVDVDIYHIRLPWTDQGPVRMGGECKLIVNQQNHLLLASETEMNDSYGNTSEILQRYDYSEIGPEDIYAVGAPRTAKVQVLHNDPDPQVEDILDRHRFYRERFPDQYISVVVSSRHFEPSKSNYVESANILFKNDELERLERRHLNNNRNAEAAKLAELEMGDTFESQFRWWWRDTNSDQRILFSEIYIYDSKYLHQFNREGDSKGKWITKKSRANRYSGSPGGNANPIHLAWPLASPHIDSSKEMSIIENDHSRRNNLICIQILTAGKISNNEVTVLPRRSLYYINPDKDCICERAEFIDQLDAPWQSDGIWLDRIKHSRTRKRDWTLTREVLEYTQTSTGKWYPKKIQNRQISVKRSDPNIITDTIRIKSIYLKENPEFPEGIFDPENSNSTLFGSQDGTGLVSPVSEETRELHWRTQCQKQLQKIGNGIGLYQNDFDAKNPPDLHTLVEIENLDRKVLLCPSSGNTQSECSYVYRGNDLDGYSSPNMIIVYDKHEKHQGQCWHVLFASLQVRQMTDEAFQVAIIQDNIIRRKKGLTEKPAK